MADEAHEQALKEHERRLLELEHGMQALMLDAARLRVDVEAADQMSEERRQSTANYISVIEAKVDNLNDKADNILMTMNKVQGGVGMFLWMSGAAIAAATFIIKYFSGFFIWLWHMLTTGQPPYTGG